MYKRQANAYRSEGGWRDCGSELQEISSHAIMLEALCDLLESGRLAEAERMRVEAHLATGADYIALCQRPEGGFVHEIRHNPATVSYTHLTTSSLKTIFPLPCIRLHSSADTASI